MRCKHVALLAVMASLCVGIQLIPRPPSIEFTSLICFLTGFLFGSFFGASLGALTMIINGFLSLWGFAGIIMPFQILGMALIGFVGGVYRKSIEENPTSHWFSLEVAFLAAFLTLVYDLITNVAYSLLFNVDIIFALTMGIWFTLVHVVSNTMLFGTTFFGLARITRNLLSEGSWSY
ncbi:MAG: ECF transporter S component [Candidatus Bathyarchaeota archaeon]